MSFYIKDGENWVEGEPAEGQMFKKTGPSGVEVISYYSAPESSKIIDFNNFVDLLTDDEYELYLDIDAYDKKASKAEKQKSVKVKRSREKLKRERLTQSDFSAIAQSFVDEGIITQTRLDGIILMLTGV